jgi:hypothetical protein
MAVGFILFAIFFVFIIFVSILAIFSLFIGIRFFLKYRKLQVKKYSFLVISIIGIGIGIFLVIVLIHGIMLFNGSSSPKRTYIVFDTTNGANDIDGIVQIKQSIGSSGSKMGFGFLNISERLYPTTYYMEFNNISEYIKKIKFNSIYFVVNNDKENIIGINYSRKYSDIIFSFLNNSNYNSNNLIEMVKLFREDRELIINTNSNNEIKGFQSSFEIDFDYESVEYITTIYNIDIELEDGEIMNIEEITIFKKEIIKEE